MSVQDSMKILPRLNGYESRRKSECAFDLAVTSVLPNLERAEYAPSAIINDVENAIDIPTNVDGWIEANLLIDPILPHFNRVRLSRSKAPTFNDINIHVSSSTMELQQTTSKTLQELAFSYSKSGYHRLLLFIGNRSQHLFPCLSQIPTTSSVLLHIGISVKSITIILSIPLVS